MIISFAGPVFFAPADEDQFFHWLGSLPEYQSIRGVGKELKLALSDPVQPETVQQLLVIFRRWNLAVTPLLPPRSPETSDFPLWDIGKFERH